ncbi:hypothetical protein [Trichormus sp. NMC-1]|uniref:hypothetical protein n=1 Tax=Trichormus sp. NMC-1 TaxID=1853259 RepID=UPI00115FED03|nr:hypothetical protein [Trichormus sp. NMC-1]
MSSKGLGDGEEEDAVTRRWGRRGRGDTGTRGRGDAEMGKNNIYCTLHPAPCLFIPYSLFPVTCHLSPVTCHLFPVL